MISVNNVKYYVRKGELTKIENYDKAVADTTQCWDCHHRLELTLDGEFAHTREELKRMGMYYNRPYFELIFLTRDEHRKIHYKCRTWTKEQREAHSKQLKEYWKSPEGQARIQGMKDAGYDGTGFKAYWEVHKDKSLPDQREEGTAYMNLYMKKYRQKKPGCLTFNRQVRLGLIPKNSVYEDWVVFYEPRKKHPWLK